MTNLQQPAEKLNALNAGGDDFINKPVQNEDLLFRIRTHLRVKELTESLRHINENLEKLVDKPLVNALVRLLRGPAHAAGFGKLQEFLEAGLGSFREMKDIGIFNETIYRREWNPMERLFAGEEEPFDRDRAK